MLPKPQCSVCNDSKHCRVLEGEGAQARWVHKPCVCVVRERLRAFLGPFATAAKIPTSPLLKFDTAHLFCYSSALSEFKDHIGHFLRRKGLGYKYRVLDIAGLGALYVSRSENEEQPSTDRDVYEYLDLVIVMLNLTSIRSQKADDLLSRAVQYRIFVSKPIWIIYSGSWEEFSKEYPASSHLSHSFARLDLKQGRVIPSSSSSPQGSSPDSRSKYGL